MAYRSDLNPRDRSGAIAAVIAIHAALLLAFLNISGKMPLPVQQTVLRVFDIRQYQPPLPPPSVQQQRPKPREKEGGSAPKNIKSEATPVVAPKPKIPTPPVQKIAATETPRQGMAPTQGASNVRGPGTGAGGVGTGTGSGAGGTGPGGGGFAQVRTRLITPPLGGRDFSPDLLDSWPRGRWAYVRMRIEANGYMSQCIIDRGTGSPAIDSAICNTAHERLRFRPGLNKFGQPVADWFAYGQRPPR